MQSRLIEKLGRRAILAGISPLAKDQRSVEPVVGFDTEYTRSRKLVCYQVAGWNGASLHTDKLTVDSLAKACKPYMGLSKVVWVVTFWSFAELQFLPTIAKSFDWHIYAAGSFDCTFTASDGTELRFFDLARFFERSKLSKVAESFGEAKITYNVKNVTRKNLKDPRFREYALHDAVLCYRIMEKLRAEFIPLGADVLESKTAAGVSAQVYRRRFVQTPHKSNNPKARVAGMLATWGGRAEALKRGRFPLVYEYDLESAYPKAAISIGCFPSGEKLRPLDTLSALARAHAGFARVRFLFPKNTHFPCLPVVLDSAQLYPLSGVSWATTFEILRARELGAKIDIVEGWGYIEGVKDLSEMMAWALEMRAGAVGARKVAAKLMANSLIGKLAQRRSGFDIEKMRAFCETEGVSIYDLIHLQPAELESLGITREARVGSCFMPEWNALITGHVRARLNRILYDSTPVYCATDSVWSTTPVPDPPADLGLKRQGPAIVVRTRLAAIMEPSGVHLAHHSLWTRRAGLRLVETIGEDPLDAPARIRYYSRRAVKLRESIRRRIRLATFLRELRVGDASWDHKRELLPGGDTRPWNDAEEYLTHRKDALKCRVSKTKSKRKRLSKRKPESRSRKSPRN